MKYTAGRENGRRRPRGYADWRPHAATSVLLDQVNAILDEYATYLPLTVRQIFYRLVGKYGYEKTENAYGRLAEHLVRARRARLIPFDWIRDDGISYYPVNWFSGVQNFHEETARRARQYRRDRLAGQEFEIELWTEAAGMAPQLAYIAHDYSIPVYSSGGFLSLTAVRSIAERGVAFSVPLVILHVGDFDPSGVAIFDSIAADAAAFVEADRHVATSRIIAERVALTVEQVETYSLPTAPPKTSDSRSKGWTETCQLEALAPDVLADIVREEILEWIDVDVLQDVLEQERADRAELLGLPRGGA